MTAINFNSIYTTYYRRAFLFTLSYVHNDLVVQSPNQKIPDRKTKCVIETHLNIKQNVIFDANLKPV